MWRDTHLRITGPSVLGLLHSFHSDWAFMELPQFDDGENFSEFQSRNNGSVGVQILSSGPVGQWHNISLMFNKAIANAKNAYILKLHISCPPRACSKPFRRQPCQRLTCGC